MYGVLLVAGIIGVITVGGQQCRSTTSSTMFCDMEPSICRLRTVLMVEAASWAVPDKRQVRN